MVKYTKILRIVFQSLILTSVSFHSFASIERFVNRLPEAGQELEVNNSVTVQDDKYINPPVVPYYNHKVDGSVIIGVNHVLSNGIDKFDYTFELEITYRDQSNSVVNISRPLSVQFDPEAVDHYDKSVLLIPGAKEIQVEILDITDNLTSNSVPSVPVNIFLEAIIEVERYYQFAPANIVSGLSHTAIDLNGDTQKDELEVYWNRLEGAEDYELEWLFVNDYTNTPSVYLSPGDIDINFKNNSTRVRIKEPYYRITLIAEHGYYVYRVRGIGRSLNSSLITQWGNWSATENGTIAGKSPNYFLHSGHETNKNWQYSSTFAEEGKKKEVISYFDGSLRNRQTATKINTDNHVIVKESIYDYLGRPAIQVLPTVTSTSNLSYYPDFNRYNSTDPYVKEHFDLDVSNCEVATPPMNNSSGAAKYYSPDNPDMELQQAYLPDAEGYPFSQVEYSPDNTGRIVRQGGVGVNMKLGSGHETRYLYAQPDQEELDRLFGSEAGNAIRYRKNTVIDPNGQASISYLDEKGRVVATSLAGPVPDNLQTINPPSGVTITSDLLMKDHNGKSLSSYNDFNDYSVNLFKHFTVTESGNYTFNYTITPQDYTDNCISPNSICFDCIYDVEISIKDECGNEYAQEGTTLKTVFGGTLLNTSCESNTPGSISPISVTLPIGKYIISKRLKVNDAAINYYVEQYLDTLNNSCIKRFSEFITEEISKIDTTDCDINTCEECIAGLKVDSFHSQSDYDRAVAECRKPCEYTSNCEILYQMMLSDVSPGGQYAEYLADLSTPNADMTVFRLSVLNEYNILPKSLGFNPQRASWRYPNNRYRDENGNIAKIYLQRVADNEYFPPVSVSEPVTETGIDGENFYYVYPEHLTNLADFINRWEPSWAEALVQYHPEYGYYQGCKTNIARNGQPMSSDEYDSALYVSDSHSSSFVIACLSTTAPFDNDPFFKTSGLGYGYRTEMVNRMTNYISKGGGQYYTMKEFAAIMNRCGTYYGTNLPSDCDDFGTGSSNELKDLEWNTLKNFYLSLKREIEQNILHSFAIETGNCYNGCIENPFFDAYAVNGFVSSPPSYSSDPYYSSDQPCNNNTNTYYKDKLRRFRNITDIVSVNYQAWDQSVNPSSVLTNTYQYNSVTLTGQCPKLTNMQFLLDRFARDFKLKDINTLRNYNEFTKDLYDDVRGSTVDATYISYNWDPALSNGNLTLTGSFYDGVNTPAKYISITLPGSTSYNWTNTGATGNTYRILKIYDLQKNGNQTPNEYIGKMIVGLSSNSIPIDTLDISGVTTINISDCTFIKVCEPTVQAQNFLKFFTFLAVNGKFDPVTQPVDVDAITGSATVLNSRIQQYFLADNIQTLFEWEQVTPHTFELKNTGDLNTLRFTFLNTTAYPTGFAYNKIKYFTSINGLPDQEENSFSIKAHYDHDNNSLTPLLEFTLRAEAIYETIITSNVILNRISMGACFLPSFMDNCGSPVQKLTKDLDYFLTDIFFFNPNWYYPDPGVFGGEFYNTGSINYELPDISTSRYFTSRMESIFGTDDLVLKRTAYSNHEVRYRFFKNTTNTPLAQEMVFKIVDPNSNYDFNDLLGFTDLLPYAQQPDGDGAYRFKIRAFFQYFSGVNVRYGSEIVEGTIFNFPLSACNDCGDSVNLVVNGDFRLYDIPLGFTNTSGFPAFYNGLSSPQILVDECDFNVTCNGTSVNRRFIDRINMKHASNQYDSHKITDHSYPSYDYFYSTTVHNHLEKQWTQEVKVKSNTNYTFSVWYNLPFTDTWSGADVRNQVIYLKVNNDVIGEFSTIMDNNWTHFSASWLSPSYSGPTEEVQLLIEVESSDHVKFAFDDISFRESPPANDCGKDLFVDGGPPVYNDTIIDPCKTQLYANAYTNATYLYTSYIDSIKRDIRQHLYENCMSPVEQFTKQNLLNEYHYTLYYYDQAGNLIKTVPPQGVNFITDPAKLSKIKQDRYNGKQTVFTEHDYCTTYEYNSLNQLISQSMPDHTFTNSWDVTASTGLPSNLVINGVNFVSSGDGYLIGNIGADGYIYMTNDGGASWTQLTSIGVPDLKAIHMTSTTVGYAVGSDGTLIKTTNGGVIWNTLGTGITNEVSDLYFSSTTSKGVIAGKNGLMRYTNDGGLNWSNSTGISASHHISKLSFETDQVGVACGYTSNGGIGVIYKTTNYGQSWTQTTNFYGLPLNHFYNVDDYTIFAVGNDGYVLVSYGSGGDWEYVPSNTNADLIKCVAYHNGNSYTLIAVTSTGALMRSINGGTAWNPITPSGSPFIRDVHMADNGGSYIYIVGDNGEMFMSADGGDSWNVINTTLAINLYAVSVVSDNSVFIGGEDAQLYYSADEGNSWMQIEDANFTATDPIVQIDALDEQSVNLLLDDGNGRYIVTVRDAQNSPNAIWTDVSIYNISVLSHYKSDKNYAIAIGSDEHTVYSENFGDTWTSPHHIGVMPAAVLMLSDMALLCDMDGVQYFLMDQGTNAAPLGGNLVPVRMNSIYYVPQTSNIISVGNNGTVWYSNNNAASWYFVKSGTNAQLNDVVFYNSSNGIVVGNTGTVLRTTTGMYGNWTQLNTGITTHLNAVKYNPANQYSLLLSGESGKIVSMSSINSGNTWSFSSAAPASAGGVNLTDLVIFNTNHVLAIGNAGKIIRSTNLGSSFAAVTDVSPPVLNALHLIPNTQLGYAVGNTGKIYKTNDRGISWTPSPSGVAVDLNGVSFFSADTGFVIGKTGTLRKTVNGGLSWSSVTTGTTADLNKIFIDPSTNYGYVVGNNATFLRTANRGSSWSTATTITSPTSIHLRGVMFQEEIGYAVGTTGRFLKSINHGQSWTTLNSGVSVDLNDVYFRDQLTGYAVGNSGKILKTNDGGATFTTEASGTTSALNDISFSSFYNGVIAGASGLSLHLSDNTRRYSSRFWYDQLGRIVASQNTRQYMLDRYSYTLYDYLNRIIEVGELEASSNISANYVNGRLDQGLFESWISANSKYEVAGTRYDTKFSLLPKAVLDPKNLRNRVAYTYFEKVDDANALTFDHATHYSYDIHGNVDTLIQDFRSLEELNSRYKKIVYSYDLISGKVNEVSYQKGQTDQFYHKYEYDGDNRILNTSTSKDGVIWERDAKYFYYHHGPLARVELGDVQLQGIDYAYTLQGWLKGVNSTMLLSQNDIGKDNGTGANTPGELHAKFGSDVYGYTLGYYGQDNEFNDYSAIHPDFKYNEDLSFEANIEGTPLNDPAYSPGLYNGNIRHMFTSLSKFNSSDDDIVFARSFKYDQLNRISEAKRFIDLDRGSNTIGVSETNKHYEIFTYDGNGNILTVERMDEDENALDRLTYNYETNGYLQSTNKLSYVSDNVNTSYTADIEDQSDPNYQYDPVGNLIYDAQEYIEEIVWTASGKISKIIRGEGLANIEYEYDASGNRISKLVKPKSPNNPNHPADERYWEYSYYVRDASGNILAIYSRKIDPEDEGDAYLYHQYITLSEVPVYGSSRLGVWMPERHLWRASFSVDSYDEESGTYGNKVLDAIYPSYSLENEGVFKRYLGEKRYELTNHLGNVLTVISDMKIYDDNKVSGLNLADIRSAQEYYVFGMPITDRQYNSDQYRFGFNGKENDNEVKGTGNQLDFGARIYDPRLGRWLSVDPMAHKYPHISPYAFTVNNPIIFIDDDGKEPITAIIDALTAFAVEAGMDFTENYILNNMDAEQAFAAIDWGNAAIEGAKSYTVSLVFTGLGSVKALKKAASSKVGRVTIEFTSNLTAELVKAYNAGELTTDGILDFTKVEAVMGNKFEGALIEALVSQGFNEKAAELEKKVKNAAGDVAKQEAKLAKNIKSEATGKATKETVANRTKKVDNAQKKLVKTISKNAGFSILKETAGKSTARGYEQIMPR